MLSPALRSLHAGSLGTLNLALTQVPSGGFTEFMARFLIPSGVDEGRESKFFLGIL